MAYPTNSPTGSPEWWLYRLASRHDRWLPALHTLRDYYDGKQRLSYAGKRFREAFGDLFSGWSDNFTGLIVDAVAERLHVDGFRWGAAEADRQTDDQAKADDRAAWRIWQRNHLDAESHLVHVDSLWAGCGYVSVWKAPGDDQARIMAESPLETIVETAPGDHRVRRAALKRWLADDGYLHATLYLPDGIYKFRSAQILRKPSDTSTPSWDQVTAYEHRRPKVGEDTDPDTGEVTDVLEPWPVPNPLKKVPIILFPNRPATGGDFKSEIEDYMPAQDAINKLVADMLVASEFVAYPQRWVTGLDLVPGEDGAEPEEPFKGGVDRLWTVPPVEEGEQETKFGEFPQADLKPYVDAIEVLVQHVSSRSRTPPHYLLGNGGVFPSGESLKAAETGLVAKVRLKMPVLAEGWEEVEALAFEANGDDTLAAVEDAETIWRNPESRTAAEVTDAAIKMKALGLPDEVLWEYIGLTPQQIARARIARQEEALVVAQSFGTPTGPPVGPQPTPAAPPAPAPTPAAPIAPRNGQAGQRRPASASLRPDRRPANGNTPPQAPLPT